jgi:DtxR family Mn-dependent transcriptional regulator
MPTSTAENYLKAIWLNEERGDEMTTIGALAKALRLTKGSVTTMAKSLASKGMVEHHFREGVRLTAEGRAVAVNVLRKHRLVETFLVQVLQMDWTAVHREAEALEHAVSDEVLDRIDTMLGHPATDPHGDPIPNRKGQLGKSGDKMTLATCLPQKPLRVVRINDQTPEFLEFIQKIGLKPGTDLRVAMRDKASGVIHCNLKPNQDTVLGFPEAGKIEVRVVG